MTTTTYQTMTVEHLGPDARESDLVEFRTICAEAQRLHPDMDDASVTDAVWGDGDYLRNARRLGVDVDGMSATITTAELVAYAESEIARLGLGDSEANCHGVAAYDAEGGVRLSDGTGLDKVCRTTDEVDAELEAMADWYAESK